MNPNPPPGPTLDMAARVRAHAWERTALGPMAAWPETLRTAVDIVLGSRLPMALAWGEDAQLIYNDAYAEFAGARHPGLLGMNVIASWPEAAEFNRHVLAEALAGRPASYRDEPMVLIRHGVPEPVWLTLEYTPLRDANGVPRGFLAILVDTTDRVRAEQAREVADRAFRQAHEQVELALDAGTVIGAWIWDVQANRVTADARFARTFGLDPDTVAQGAPVDLFMGAVHPADRALVQARIAEAMRHGGRFRAQYRVIDADGNERWIEAVGRCQHDAEGRAVRFPGLLFDAQERKLAERQQRILINELNHRVKNTLAIVQSLAAQSFRHAGSLEAAAEVFNARLISLSHAQDVLTREQWQSARLGDLVEQTARSHGFFGTPRFRIDGPNVRLSPQHALSFAMALHELATNAIKYGALGEDGGQVQVTWQLESGSTPPVLELTWSEHGGPPVQAPVRTGFGTRLIERSLGLTMDGRVVFDYRPGGLICRMRTLLPRIQPAPGAEDGGLA